MAANRNKIPTADIATSNASSRDVDPLFLIKLLLDLAPLRCS
jgi:hypothetical protein